MAFIPDTRRIREAESKLVDRLNDILRPINLESETSDLFAAINELISARVEAAVVDLENKMNKTGDWDPDY